MKFTLRILVAEESCRSRESPSRRIALQMFENAVSLDPNFALAYAAIANVCAQTHYNYGRDPIWLKRAEAASQRAVRLQPHLPEVLIAQAWILYAAQNYEDAMHCAKQAVDRKRDCEGAYYLLCRALFASGRHQEIANIADKALDVSGEDYNCYVPIMNALEVMGKKEAVRNTRQRRVTALENHIRHVPEDARARILLGGDYAAMDRVEDAYARQTSPSRCVRMRLLCSTMRRAIFASSSANQKLWQR